jgi:putative PIN family toxin of toxin-antitoxin system
MRIILDANIFISYLLAPDKPRTITEVVEHCFENPAIEMVVPRQLLEDISRTVRAKKYLRSNIHDEDLTELLEAIELVALTPQMLDDIPRIFTDPNDDYLFAYALVEEIDYLVTGDRLMLELRNVEGVKIIEVTEFWQILELDK